MAAGKVLDQVKGAGQDMVGRDDLERGDVKRRSQLLKMARFGRGAPQIAKVRVARIEQDHAPRPEEAVQLLVGGRRGRGLVNRYGPIKEGQNGNVVTIQIDAHRLARLDRGARGQDPATARQAPPAPDRPPAGRRSVHGPAPCRSQRAPASQPRHQSDFPRRFGASPSWARAPSRRPSHADQDQADGQTDRRRSASDKSARYRQSGQDVAQDKHKRGSQEPSPSTAVPALRPGRAR